MKKTISLLTALIVSASLFACHPEATGYCTGSAYYKLIAFEAGYQFQYEYMNGQVLEDTTITTIDNSEPSIHIPQPNSNTVVTLRWRFKKNTGGWSTWETTQSLCGIDADLCYTVMPVSMSNLTASRKGNLLTVSFTAGAEELDHYNIQVSNDAQTWETKQVLKATKEGIYKTIINLTAKTVAGIGLFLLPFVGFKGKRRLLASLAILCSIFYFSCSKENVKPDNGKDYKYARVQGIDSDGGITNSNVIRLNY